MVAIFPKLCLWRRSLCSNLGGTGPEKLYRATLRQKAKKKFPTRGLFISAISHVKLIAETRVYICHKNMKSMGFLQFYESFRGKIYTKYSIGNEERIEFETVTITSDCVVQNHLSI